MKCCWRFLWLNFACIQQLLVDLLPLIFSSSASSYAVEVNWKQNLWGEQQAQVCWWSKTFNINNSLFLLVMSYESLTIVISSEAIFVQGIWTCNLAMWPEMKLNGMCCSSSSRASSFSSRFWKTTSPCHSETWMDVALKFYCTTDKNYFIP